MYNVVVVWRSGNEYTSAEACLGGAGSRPRPLAGGLLSPRQEPCVRFCPPSSIFWQHSLV
ncbi:hypothetical protein CHLRE_02g142647v5 [Chlamydomonas reinhardtii]|uniref:Uncharacterized protein n=1 Tax=Chlamydomonas reinhardtii TaxID=3055 RepID=A0A2K3E4F6_CHLRE|nr:uncharacterized protein CHLRE_02g142647v5 [Chlamydomonas reinhardtii]PNW87674.1 hypothetical protein CHLRE_02g142647v5 [Chlamydomonas reinhardtii]